MSFLQRMNDAALQSARDLAASQPRADIGSVLPTLGTVAGTIFGGPVGAAIGGAAGSAIDGLFGGSSGGSSTTNAINNGLTAAETAELGQQAATGDANEVANLVKTAQGAVGTNTSQALQEFLELAQAYGPPPSLSATPATLGAAPQVQGLGSNAKVAPTPASAPQSGGVTPGSGPPQTSGNIQGALNVAQGLPAAGNGTASMTPAQQAAVSQAVSAAIAKNGANGTYQNYGNDIVAGLTSSGAFTPAEVQGLAGSSWLSSLASNPAQWQNSGGGNTGTFLADDSSTLDSEFATLLANNPSIAGTTTAPTAGAAAPVVAPGVAPTIPNATAQPVAVSPAAQSAQRSTLANAMPALAISGGLHA